MKYCLLHISQALTVLTQVNHNYSHDNNAIIPDHLLAVMEQARPGTLKEYADILLAEPRHRRKLELHDSYRASFSLFGNYVIAFALIGTIAGLSYFDKYQGAIGASVIAVTQMLAILFKKKSAEPEVKPPPTAKTQVQKSKGRR
jgi:hypothetical protein